jgi:hypothetical protein
LRWAERKGNRSLTGQRALVREEVMEEVSAAVSEKLRVCLR